MRAPLFIASMAFLSMITAAMECGAQGSYRRPEDRAVEIAQLPKYCYGQYVDTKLYGNPEFDIRAKGAACGIGMNHFCPALLMLIRAQNATLPRPKRKDQLARAKIEVKYTLDRMGPGCIYKQDVFAAEQRVRVLEMTLR